jgi:hypothetical protein
MASGKTKGHRILIWLAFSVLFALTPLFVDFLLTRETEAFQLSHLLGRGELLLISAALCADAVGRMWGQKAQPGYFSTICLVCCVFVLVLSSIEFGMYAPTLDAGKRLPEHEVMDSLKMFGVTVAVGLGAVFVEEE